MTATPATTAVPRALYAVVRAVTIGVLTPVVALLGVATLAGLAVLGTARLLRSALRPRRHSAPAVLALDVPFYAATESSDARAVRQAA